MSDPGYPADNSEDGQVPPRVSVIVPTFDNGEDLDRCLEAVNRSGLTGFECIVVDDASSEAREVAVIARRHGARLLRLEQRGGPALARNAGVMEAQGEIVFFTDADVLLHADAMQKGVEVLESEPDVAAVFGSYDDSPGNGSLISRYRNLYHHWNHQIGNEEASTFWTGCGAIRKAAFTGVGGFSSDYGTPSIEDIELGYRLREAGYRIRLLKTMLGTHLKDWTFRDMVMTDIFKRGVPWVALLWRYRSAPPDLNLNPRARIATMCAALLPLTILSLLLAGRAGAVVPTAALFLAAAACSRMTDYSRAGDAGKAWLSALAFLTVILLPLAALAWYPDPAAILPLMLIAIIVWEQRDFYRLLYAHGGAGFAVAAVPLQLVFFLCCALAVPLGILAYLRNR